ncbi:MAG: carboxynorspermidine decarboxylase [Proteobacteria bacterium]|nr:carboxynorspermidine decarboxylase [Pseudomonadota bacterium]
MNPLTLPVSRTPAYVIDVAALKKNLQTAARIKKESGCKILLATKAFATPATFPIMREVLDGTTASGLYEAKLGREEFGKEVHVFSPAYKEEEIKEFLGLADDIYFNSIAQLRRFLPTVKQAGKKTGIRFNPGYSKATVGGALYDPCSPTSRFGILPKELDQVPWDDVHILHAHALCEAMHDGSVGLIEHIGKNFGPYIKRVKAVNFGGGHFINKKGYDVDALIKAIKEFRAAYNVEVILEPGGALVYNAGYLVATVLDIHPNEKNTAILDASATCHMPDSLLIPFTPPVIGAGEPGAHPHNYLLGARTCMTGDVFGEYSFPQPLKAGDQIIFGDGLQYNLVQATTFNGTPLPDIVLLNENGKCELARGFGYEDFRKRLG